MRTRSLRAFLASCLVAGTSVLITASPAQAASFALFGEPYLNQAVAHANVEYGGGGYIAQAVSASFDTSQDSWSTGNYGTNARHLPGGSATLEVDWTFQNVSGDCEASVDNPNKVRIEIRNMNGSQIGDDKTVTRTGCDSQTSFTVYFDNNPLDGNNSQGDLAEGTYELYLKVLDDAGTDDANLSGADSRGAAANGPLASQYYARGFFYVGGHMAGWHQKSNDVDETEWIEDDLGKDFPIIRDFKSSWDTPSGRVDGWASEGKIVHWSVKPPAWSGSDSPWYRAEADTSMIDDQLRSLQDSADTHSVPYMLYTVHHEPHDEASDFDTDPDESGTQAKCSGTECDGTVQEFKDLYATMMSRKAVACGTSPTYGEDCDKVLIAYTGVVTYMTLHASGQGVGSADTMYPGDANVDILGVDPYNWGCFRQEEAPDPDDCRDDSEADPNHEWRSLEDALDDPSENDSFLDLAAVRDKKVFLGEVGSHPGCDGTETTFTCNGSETNDPTWDRGTWFEDMADWLQNDDEAVRYIVGFAYYHSKHAHDWYFVDFNDEGYDDPDTIIDNDNRGYSEWKTEFVNNSLFEDQGVYFTLDPTPTS